jgi:hypothetical protein
MDDMPENMETDKGANGGSSAKTKNWMQSVSKSVKIVISSQVEIGS